MEEITQADIALYTTNNMWILLATVLVFIMHLGFATLEAGFVRSKNVVNILFKNVIIISIGLITYCLVGFNLMYPGDFNGFLGFAGLGLTSPEISDAVKAAGEGFAVGIDYADGSYSYWADFIFQGMFAATCATIVSGAVAERIKLAPFFIFSIVFVAFVYPIAGSWKWGGGWLDQMGFYDFAGSSIVHAAGGAAALASVLLLGARAGKYTEKGMRPIPGHNMTLATIGVFLLWFGWFGFNGGSVLSADANLTSLVFVTTSLAAAAGALSAFLFSYILFKSHDLSMALNGILGGLVAITAGADLMTPTDAIIVGAIGGMIIPFSVQFFDKIKIDDPVGATSVHLVCGVWGTLAVGLFGSMASGSQFVTQLIGTLSYVVFAFVCAFIIMFILKKTTGIRVSAEEEARGLDIAEHEMKAYQID